MMEFCTTTSSSTDKMPTLEELKRLMDEHRRQFPPSEIAEEVSGSRWTLTSLLCAVHKQRPELVGYGVHRPLEGIRIRFDNSVPHGYYRIKFMDGKSKQWSLYGGEPTEVEELPQPGEG